MWFASQRLRLPRRRHAAARRDRGHASRHLQPRDRWWWHCRGYTPAGVECWNGIRGIDYLCRRPDVDADKIGVTGISGGGATTFWIAAADDRVKVAVPVSGMSDLESYVTNKVINGHCDCMFLVQHLPVGLDDDRSPCIAPRPLLFANSDNDPIFPMDGNRRIIDRLRQVLRDARQAKDTGRRLRQRRAATTTGPTCASRSSILQQAPEGATTRKIEDADFPKIEGKDLRVFPTDETCRRTRSTPRSTRRSCRGEGEAAGGEGVRGVEGGVGEATAREELPVSCRKSCRASGWFGATSPAIASKRPATAN